MYNEFEEAVAGPPNKGRSILGWIGVAAVGVVFVGIAVAMIAFFQVRSQVREVVEQFENDPEFSATISEAIAEALTAIDAELLTHNLELNEALSLGLENSGMDAGQLQDIIEGSLRIHTDDGEITADLRGDEEGGSLVVRTPDGDVSIELAKSEDGGDLLIRTDNERLEFSAGGGVHEPPAWVPEVRGMPSQPKQLFSANTGEGTFAVVSWEADAGPEEIVDWYRERLQDEGFDLEAEHSLRGRRDRSASVVGRDESRGRLVFLTVSTDDGVSKVVLGYGEGIDR